MDGRKLKALPSFSSLGKHELGRVAACADEVDVREGEELLHEGNFAHEFMVVIEGRAEVMRGTQSIGHIGPGDFLGEVAALDDGRRNATVVARSAMTLAVMTARDLRRIARDIPALAGQLREAARAHSPTPE